MLLDYLGADLFGSNGEPIGTIRRTYADDSGFVRYAAVELDTGDDYRLVPMDSAAINRRGLQVPFSAKKVAASPQADTSGPMLNGQVLDLVRNHYAHTVQDEGGVIEIPLFEEVLVKKTVVREVLRIRKRWITEEHLVETDLRREDVEVTEEGQVGFRVREVDLDPR